MKKNLISLFLVFASSAILLTGCGGSYKDSEDYRATALDLADNGDFGFEAMEVPYEEEALNASGTETGSIDVVDNSRKLIKTVYMNVETENLDAALADVESKVLTLGGYIEYSDIYNGNRYDAASRRANLNVRIPAKNLDTFVNIVSSATNVVSKNMNVSDVTLEYVDVEARKDSLVAEQKRLIELMASAENIEDIISIEERLSNIEYEIDSAERRLRTFDNKVDYSTVSLDISEVVKYTNTEEKSRFERITEGFTESVSDVYEGILDFFVDFVIAIPYLIVIAIVVIAIVLIIKGIIKHNKKKKLKRQAKLQAAYEKTMMQQQSVPVNEKASVPSMGNNNDGK